MNIEILINPLKIIVLLTFTAFLASCGGEGDSTTSTATDTLSSLFDKEIKGNGCALNCHSPGGSASPGPDMRTKESFYLGLVNKNALNYLGWGKVSNCSNVINFVTPGNIAQSMLLATFVQAQSDALVNICTTSYNFHVDQKVGLSLAGVANFTSWINKGALNN